MRQKPKYLEIRNWERFQHYRNRRPVWIKFHVELLDDVELRRLPYATRLLWDQLLLLAARLDNLIPNDAEEIANMTRIDYQSVEEGVALLLQGAWLREKRASKTLADGYQPASKTLASRAPARSQEAEAEAEKEKGSAVRSETTPHTNGLPLDKELITAAILTLIGTDGDDNTPDVVRALSKRLPPAALAKVRESLETQKPRNRAAYAVGALQSEFAELATRP